MYYVKMYFSIFSILYSYIINNCAVIIIWIYAHVEKYSHNTINSQKDIEITIQIIHEWLQI